VSSSKGSCGERLAKAEVESPLPLEVGETGAATGKRYDNCMGLAVDLTVDGSKAELPTLKMGDSMSIL
jgi:hypothetical protein